VSEGRGKSFAGRKIEVAAPNARGSLWRIQGTAKGGTGQLPQGHFIHDHPRHPSSSFESLLCCSERLFHSTLLYSSNSLILHTSTTWPRSSVLPSFARSALRCPLAASSQAPLPSRPSPHSLLLSQGNRSSRQPSLGTLCPGLPE